MPLIDDDEEPWPGPVELEPPLITEARERGRMDRRMGLTTSHSPYTSGTLSHAAYLAGWDSEALAIARRNGWTFKWGEES